jgi:hypothetical protein
LVRESAIATVACAPPLAGGPDCPDHGRTNIACVEASIAWETRAICAQACV